MRFELKHGQAKKTANNVCNSKNICKSLLQKHQLKFSYRLMARDSLSDEDLVVGTGCVMVVEPSRDVIDNCLAMVGMVGEVFSAKWIE